MTSFTNGVCQWWISQNVAFVIDGYTLELALEHERAAFTDLALLAKTALCCRVTPSQKADVCFLLCEISLLEMICPLKSPEKTCV